MDASYIHGMAWIQTPHIWQIENSLHLCQGTDVIITAKTGSGKSALTLAPVIARHLRNEPHVAIVVYLTEALISNQVSINLKWCMRLLMGTYFIQEGKVQRRGVCFIAISLNILGHATMEGRNLWREVEDGMWDVIKATHPRGCTFYGYFMHILSVARLAVMF